MKISLETHTLTFQKPAKTSRGEYLEKQSHLLRISNETKSVVGEASPLSDLSLDGKVDFHQIIDNLSDKEYNFDELLALKEDWNHYPALRFALDCALKKWISNHENPNLWVHNEFTNGKIGIHINGLVWMNQIEAMEQEAFEKVQTGFSCIKFKVGALDFDAECRLLERFRRKFSAFQVEIRLDANGAFAPDEALIQLRELKRFDIHSIEQPIKPNQWDALAEICAKSPIDIALDEELIGQSVNNAGKMLKSIHPKYIILKPTLLGGFDIADQWITAAEKQEIGWWSTSALEGNIGLADIAQWASTHELIRPQGLGTGSLFIQNFSAQTRIVGQQLFYIPS